MRHLCILLVLSLSLGHAAAQPVSTFTYQGSLTNAASPADGTFNLDFSLWDALAGGTQIGSTQSSTAHPVANGFFTVELNFGINTFDNANRWLEVAVDGQTLTPRQPITRAPYALQTHGVFADDASNIGLGTTCLGDHRLTIKQARSTTDFGLRILNGEETLSFQTWVGTGGVVLDAEGAANLHLQTASADRLFIENATGRVGIGTTTPEWELDVIGGIHAQGVFFSSGPTGGSFITRNPNNQNASFSLGWADDLPRIRIGGEGAGADRGFDIQTVGNRSLLRILHNGNVGLGTTNPLYPLHVTTSSADRAVYGSCSSDGTSIGVMGESATSTGLPVGVWGQASSSAGMNVGVWGSSNSAAGYDFYANGAGVNFGSPSSIRWKNNIEPVADPLGMLAQIRAVYYDWDEEHGGNRDIGFIGEEVGRVLPEIVAYEEDGQYVTGMDYGRMTPLLVEAVNTLRAEKDTEIRELQIENAQLRSSLGSIQSQLSALDTLIRSKEVTP